MDSEQMLVNWLLETLQNGSSWLLFNHNVLTKTATRNLATHECGSINEIRSIRHFHFCINQKWKYIKYSLENQFSIFFWCGSMHCVWVTRTLVWALESVLSRKPLFSCWIRSRVKTSTNQDFLVFCKNIAPYSSYENFEGTVSTCIYRSRPTNQFSI